MKTLTISCLVAALPLISFGFYHQGQVDARNEAAHALHEQQMQQYRFQESRAQMNQQLDAQQAKIELISQRRINEIQLQAQEQEALQQRAALWRDVVTNSALDAEKKLRAAQEAGDKDRGF